jgi:hypothetical protein
MSVGDKWNNLPKSKKIVGIISLVLFCLIISLGLWYISIKNDNNCNFFYDYY